MRLGGDGDASPVIRCDFYYLIRTESFVSLDFEYKAKLHLLRVLVMLTKSFVSELFIEPNEFILRLDGLVICAGIIEAMDGDGNRKELESGKGNIGRARLYALETRREVETM